MPWPPSLPIDGFGTLFRWLWGGGSGAGFSVLQGGVPIMTATSLNFVSGTTVVDGGGQQADLTVTGGSGGEDFAATCAVADTVGQIVYLTGAPGPAIAPALGIHPGSTFPAIGFISVKSTPTVCVVQTDGELNAFAGLTPGVVYYLDPTTPGAITSTAPIAAGQVVQKVGQAKDATTLLINTDDDFTLLT